MSETVIDWNAAASLIERDDAGSEMYFEFRTLASGPLSDLVAQVASLTPEARARLVIDRGIAGTIAVQDIMALAARPDFPGNAQ
ncbi:MAG: hypothetical protein K2X31_05315 [Sphingopyxis sp.]|jgi:hypothetical protein|nr:hypothetical protein [Sphingopyxis sp.]